MPSANPHLESGAQPLIPESGMDPLAPLEALAHGLFKAAIHLTVGFGLGVLAARAMRRRHVHWSWSAGALALVVLGGDALAGWGETAAAAALTAAMHGRRWHREDQQAGVDLAEAAMSRLSPLDVLRVGARRLWDWLVLVCGSRLEFVLSVWGRGPGGDGRWFRGGELIVGEDDRARRISIPIGGADGGAHTLVLGATGSGKTVTQTWMAVRAVERGMAVIVVDPKGDGRLRAELSRAARAAGRRFVVWTPAGPSVYNPFARGGTTEIADKLLAGERFSEPHYMRQAQRYLGHAVRALGAAGMEVSLARIVRELDPRCLELLARDLPEAQARELHAYLDSLTPRQRTDLSGVRDRLAIMAESDVGKWLDPHTPGAKRFDLLVELHGRAVVYFGLQADRRPLLAEMLGAAIVQDLQSAMGALQGRPAPALVVIDEFSAVAAERVVRLFERGRSAGMSLVLGTQELSDLRVPGRERLLEQVLGNVSTLLAHRQAVPDSAELISRMSGKRGAWSSSLNSAGGVTRKRVREPLIRADEIGALARGCAAVLVLGETRRARVVRMYSPGEDT